MKNTLISVIVPVYNQEKLITRCISSILNQDYTNFELLLINDGSTDSSLQKCQSFKDKRIKIFSQKNSGVSVARNVGLSHSRGQWISFVDPDDYLEKNFLSFLISKVTSDKVDIVSCSAYAVQDNHTKQVNSFFNSNLIIKTQLEKKPLFMELMNDNYGKKKGDFRVTAIGVPWGKLYRKQFLDENNLIFNPMLRRMQDNIFNMYAFKFARVIKYINKPLYNYSTENITNFMRFNYKFKDYYLANIIEFIKERFTFMNKYKLFKDKDYKKSYENEALALLNSVLNFYILSQDTPFKLYNQKEMILRLFNDPKFNIATNLKMREVTGFSTKIVYIAMKLKNPYILIEIWKLKINISKLKSKTS